jgi:hypothetical protein
MDYVEVHVKLRVIVIIILYGIFLITISSCKSRPLVDDLLGERVEALAWLSSNSNPYAFAGNRFESTETALAFVQKLYDHGALEIYVTNVYDEAWRIEAEGGPYADTLIILLPDEEEARRDLFAIANDEARQEGFSPEADTGQEELLLWWD